MITRAWKFEAPIELDDDDGVQTQVRLAMRPQYVERVKSIVTDTPGLGLGEISKLCGAAWKTLSDEDKARLVSSRRSECAGPLGFKSRLTST